MADLGDLSRLMRKSNILAEQVAWVMEEDGDVAAAWQGRVSERWVEPALRLLESVGHNVQSSVKVLSDKPSDVGAKIEMCKKRKRGAEGGDRKAQAERKRVLARYNNITSQLSSLSSIYIMHVSKTFCML